MKSSTKRDLRGFLWHVAPALLCVAVIFWLGSIRTAIEIPQELFAKDKVNHFVAFGVLALLSLRAFRFEFTRLSGWRLIAVSVASSSLVGALLELWQSLLPYRSAEVLDWVADTLGALLAGFAGYIGLRWRAGRMGRSHPTQ